MTIVQALLEGQNRLKEAGIADYISDSSILFEYVTGLNHSDLIIHGEDSIEDALNIKYKELIDRRIERIPVQHLTGVQNFMGYDFNVNENVLIPRFDTEILVDRILKYLKDGMSILDVCTGSGCIAVSLMLLRKNISAVATDISDKALEVARSNSEKYALKDISFVQTDLVEGIEGEFDLIVSNPPYIESQVINELEPEVKNHEPMLALDGGEDGLIFYRRLVKEAVPLLKVNGMMAVEIGYNQGKEVKGLFLEAGLKEVAVIKDFANLDRVVIGYK